jgi:hypothetical protein
MAETACFLPGKKKLVRKSFLPSHNERVLLSKMFLKVAQKCFLWIFQSIIKQNFTE